MKDLHRGATKRNYLNYRERFHSQTLDGREFRKRMEEAHRGPDYVPEAVADMDASSFKAWYLTQRRR